jgi:hypothetical protein
MYISKIIRIERVTYNRISRLLQNNTQLRARGVTHGCKPKGDETGEISAGQFRRERMSE